MYPHPFDCSLFLGCKAGVMETFSCPTPLLFDPIRKSCEYPSQFLCDISCQNKTDGRYPHSQDCSLYISCNSGVATFFKCPNPLLFDPEQLGCWVEDEVECVNNVSHPLLIN